MPVLTVRPPNKRALTLKEAQRCVWHYNSSRNTLYMKDAGGNIHILSATGVPAFVFADEIAAGKLLELEVRPVSIAKIDAEEIN